MPVEKIEPKEETTKDMAKKEIDGPKT